MAESTPVNLEDPGLNVGAYFLRQRNTLMTRADLGPLFVDYYLHLADNGIRHAPEHDRLFKAALASFVLHCASRPRNEMIAWTLHFQDPRLNVFLTGDNETSAVTGRLFDEDVRDMGGNFFYADVVRANQPKRRSVAEFQGADPLAAVEAFYRSSEQRGVRMLRLSDEEYALLSEHPDCDRAWLDTVGVDEVRSLQVGGEVSLLETRVFRWHCGCNQRRMLQVLAPVFRDDPEGLFGGDASLEMRCPRCGARHRISRPDMDAFVSEQGGA